MRVPSGSDDGTAHMVGQPRSASFARAAASRIARPASTPATWRRYAAVAWMSLPGSIARRSDSAASASTSGVRDFSREPRLGFARPHGPVSHPGQGEPRLPDPVARERHDGSHADERVVSVAAGQLDPGRARARRGRGEPDLGQELGRREGRGQLGQEEVPGRDGPLARRPAGRQARLEAQRHGRQLGRRVGVAQAAADGPAVPDLEVPDPRERVGQERRVPGGERAPLHGALSGHRPDGEAAGPDPDVRQLRDAVEVDQPLGRGEAHVQERDEALAPGEELRLVAVLRELGDGLVDRADGRVLEDGGLHSRGHSGRGRRASSTRSTSAWSRPARRR